MERTSALLAFAEDQLQIIALTVMVVVYIIKVRWILSFAAGKERQAHTGRADTNAKKGGIYSLFNVAMPWAMASTRQHPLFWLQFAVFHTGVAVSILMSFLIPYAPGLISSKVAIIGMQSLFAAAFAIGLGRTIRRLASPYMRAISAPDDFFSVALLTVWFAFAFMAAPNNRHETEFWLLGYFLLTAFFLIYVPFSKISHYIFYPFTRWYFGKTMGHRGVFPMMIEGDNVRRSFMRPNQFIEGKGK